MPSTNQSYKRFGNILLRTVIIGLLFGGLAYQLFYQEPYPDIARFYHQLVQQTTFWIGAFVVVVFMLMNWAVEAWKWKKIAGKAISISYFGALKGVLGGVTLSMVMPNRMGEYVGRTFFLPRGQRIKGLFLTLAGVLSQLIVIFFCGIAGLYYFLHYYGGTDTYLMTVLGSCGLLLMVLLLLVYYQLMTLPAWLSRWKVMARFARYFKILRYFRSTELTYYLFLSLLRYAIFTAQYLILLYMFDVKLPLPEGVLLVMLAFFMQTVLPAPALVDLGVRGNVALFVFGRAGAYEEWGIVSAALALWSVNLLITALVGSYFWARARIFY